MNIAMASNQATWDAFLATQTFSPFLQSWTMGEVYRDTGQEPMRLEIREGNTLIGICQAIIVPARRGRHLAIPYGPVGIDSTRTEAWHALMAALQKTAREQKCTFIRISPFWPADTPAIPGTKPSPLHLLAEHIWYLPLIEQHPWALKGTRMQQATTLISQAELLKNMRKNTRNLIHRAEREGVYVERSAEPLADLPIFMHMHEETRKRHGFTPYTDAFFHAQVARFAARNECTLYLARYKSDVLAASIHMHIGGETSYHHGASTQKHPKIPASHLLQWTAIQDALARKDHTYSFWGIAPEGVRKHPFAGVTLFKRGFGGTMLELVHCQDFPLSTSYALTRSIEIMRKWKRGF